MARRLGGDAADGIEAPEPGGTKHCQWCRENRHLPVCEQHVTLSQKVRGHYAYYGITGNFRMLKAFLRAVERTWRWWLSRRSRRRDMDWERFNRLLKRYGLPPPRVVHSAVKVAKQ